jgi:hypothetical protein
MTCPQTSTLGVYLLGALEPEDRSTFESHLYGCDVCRAELVRLAPLPGLLNQITLADFDEAGTAALAVLETEAPPIDLPPPFAEVSAPPVVREVAEPDDTPVEAKPRKRFWLAAAAAALVVALAVGAVLVYNAMTQPGASSTQAVTWTATNPATGARADVVLTQKTWGTDLRVWMSNIPPGRECKLVITARDGYHETVGYREVAGWWRTDHDRGEEVPGATSIDVDMIYRMQFIDDNDMLLVDMHAPR